MKSIKGASEEHRRSALKTISWRVIATSTGMLLVYAFTGRLELTASFGIGDIALKMIFYFLHERVWNRISYGRGIAGSIESAMRSPPLTALPSDPVSNVIAKMVSHDAGSVIIVDDDRPFGLITESDILGRVLNAGKNPSVTLAKDIMSSPVETVDYNQSLTNMLKMMRDKQIRRLVVTQNGKVKGIVHERRILEALV